MDSEQLAHRIDIIESSMYEAARKTDFIEAARLRDEWVALKELQNLKVSSF